MPRFSICIPNFNYGRYLGRTLGSVLAQDFADFEVIVADNASTDDSVEVVERFGDPRVRVLRNRINIGFSPNLDRATRDATGEFLLLLSSDDVMNPGALRRYDEVLRGLGERSRRAVLTSAIDIIDGEDRRTEAMYRARGDLFYTTISAAEADRLDWSAMPVEETGGLEALAATLRAKNSPAVFLATCYSRELYDEVEGYSSCQRIFPDGHFLNKLLARDPVFVYVPERLFSYRVHQSNQLGVEAKQGALKYQVDAYMHTVEFPEDVLRQLGIARQDLVDVFIEKGVVERGLQAMAAGQTLKAFRCLAFGLAAYPAATVREPKTYALAGLLALGPLGSRAAGKLYDGYRKLRER